ncbi:hypothetical protein ACFPRL_10700 [Pseudoclavibacter helvolus]
MKGTRMGLGKFTAPVLLPDCSVHVGSVARSRFTEHHSKGRALDAQPDPTRQCVFHPNSAPTVLPTPKPHTPDHPHPAPKEQRCLRSNRGDLSRGWERRQRSCG